MRLPQGTRRYAGSEAEDASGYQEYERSTCLQAGGGRGCTAGQQGGAGARREYECSKCPQFDPLAGGSADQRSLAAAARPALPYLGPACPALQMVGRAGRPQFDVEGVAVIMTAKQVRPLLAA